MDGYRKRLVSWVGASTEWPYAKRYAMVLCNAHFDELREVILDDSIVSWRRVNDDAQCEATNEHPS